MHELSICGYIADIVTRHADGRPVEGIQVRIGQLRQVVPDTLTYCWTLVSSDTDLDGSRLEIEDIPARITCKGCGRTNDLGPFPVLLCTACDSADVEVVTGQEFEITSIDLVKG